MVADVGESSELFYCDLNVWFIIYDNLLYGLGM
jgi:hypothetical protein